MPGVGQKCKCFRKGLCNFIRRCCSVHGFGNQLTKSNNPYPCISDMSYKRNNDILECVKIVENHEHPKQKIHITEI